MQLLAKDPAKRPTSADDVALRLAKLATPVVEAMSRAEVASANDPWAHFEDSAPPDVLMASKVEPEGQAKGMASPKHQADERPQSLKRKRRLKTQGPIPPDRGRGRLCPRPW